MPAALLILAALVQEAAPVEALVYSTMPSLWANRPAMAMDGDAKTAFRSVGGMEEMDDFRIVFGQPVALKTIRVTTGDASGDDVLEDAVLETSADGTRFVKAADFRDGAASASPKRPVVQIRIRMRKGHSAGHLAIREIDLGRPVHAQMGPGRGFVDLNGNADLRGWADRAEAQMESFWPDAAALLYSPGFVTPNAVNVVYETGPGVTPVAATGGGKMQVNTAWCRAHPEDTGLTVHEMAHVIQSGGAPGWLIEAVADYIRWVRFEPQNFTYRIDPRTATPHDPYRTGAAFLGYLELHYDPRLVTKLNDATRFGRYSDALFEATCGKPIDALWKEFLTAYGQDPKGVLTPPLPPAMRPRPLPAATASAPVDMSYVLIGVFPEGAKFRGNGGFDEGGAAYSGAALGRSVTTNGVTFRLGPVGAADVLPARGQTVGLRGRHASLWLLAAAIEGSQRDQTMTVAYADGTSARLDQNFSDWYAPEAFPGEVRAVKMPYRAMADGSRDPRPFYVYAYGFPLDAAKELRSVTLPDDPNIRVMAISVGD